jgi:hypothetical protein
MFTGTRIFPNPALKIPVLNCLPCGHYSRALAGRSTGARTYRQAKIEG